LEQLVTAVVDVFLRGAGTRSGQRLAADGAGRRR